MKQSISIYFAIFFLTIKIGLVSAQPNFKVPAMPDPAARLANLKLQWEAVQKTPPQLGVRDVFTFVLDALDANFLKPEQIEWVLKLVQTRMIHDPNAGRSYGNIFWGWHETGNDIGDGNNIEFCMQYGMPIKLLFNDRLSEGARKTLDEIFTLGLKGARNQEVRISYTNIYLMKIWNFVAFAQVYQQPAILEEGRNYFNQWLKHVSRYGNREYDSPTYCGVDLESLLLLYRFAKDEDIRSKTKDVIQFFLNDLCMHYNKMGGYLGGAHSRDYNRVFGRDLLEEKYFNPLIGRKNNNIQLFNQLCLSTLQEIGLTKEQEALMTKPNRYSIQRWDSLAHTYAVDYVGKKVSIASSNQYYSPDDKPFVMYLFSPSKPEMPNIAFAMEGRDDHYGTWSNTGMGDKMKHLMPANYPANGGWGKTRHLMPFMQSAQHKGEFVMLVAGERDHNCIKPYVNSTIILPNYFDEIWLGNQKISAPAIGASVALDKSNTFFAKFEDVVIAFRYLMSNADDSSQPKLFNDGFKYQSKREKFQMQHSQALRLTLQHPNNGKAVIAMWWKTAEGIKNAEDFRKFRAAFLAAPLQVSNSNGIVEAKVTTSAGVLGVKADLNNKKRLEYYHPMPLPTDFLFQIDGKEIGKTLLDKYKN